MGQEIKTNELEKAIKRQLKINKYTDNLREGTYRFYNEDEELAVEPETEEGGGDELESNTNLDNNEVPDIPVDDTTIEPDIESEVEQDEETTEIDITDLVNTNNKISQSINQVVNNVSDYSSKIDMITQRISGLEGNLNNINVIINKLGDLEREISLMRPPTEEEKKEVLKITSYPFNTSPEDFVNDQSPAKTQTDMELSSNKLGMMSNLMSDYDKDKIKRSFYPNDDEEDKAEYQQLKNNLK